MSYEPPSPPANLSTEIVDALNEATPEHLRDVGRYAEALAEHKERETRLKEEADNADVEERPDDLPDDVPAKATITIKDQQQSLLLLAVAGRREDSFSVPGSGQPGRVKFDDGGHPPHVSVVTGCG